MNDVRQELAGNVTIALRHGAGQLDDVLRIDQRLVRAAVSFLQSLRVRLRHTQSVHDVTRHVIAAESDGAKMTNLALVEDR